jgi:hypothetical protein
VGLAGEIQVYSRLHMLNVSANSVYEKGGWIAANAALGYTAAEMQAGRNIVAELRNT